MQALAPTFGGINLEDIKAPECFCVEERLRAELSIPVFHDDQRGTAIIVGAALLNGLEILDKSLLDVRIVISGAGAAGIACADMACALGLTREQLLLVDSNGVVHRANHRNSALTTSFPDRWTRPSSLTSRPRWRQLQFEAVRHAGRSRI